MAGAFFMKGAPMPEPENTPPEAGKYLEPELQDGVTQDPDDTRAEKGEL